MTLAWLALSAAARPPDLVLHDGAPVEGDLVSVRASPGGPDTLAWRAGGLWHGAEPGTTTVDLDPSLGPPVLALDHDGDATDNLVVLVDGPALFDHTAGRPLDVPWWGHAAVADVDADGHDDLIDALGVLHGGTAPARGVALDGVDPDSFYRAWSVGDLDGDGLGDVAVCASTTDLPADALRSDASLRLHLAADLGPDGWPARWAWDQAPLDAGDDGPGSDGYRGYADGIALAVADVDGDSAAELVVLSLLIDFTDYRHTLTILDDLLAPDAPRVRVTRDYRSYVAPALHALGDVDADGDDDVLFVTDDLVLLDAAPDPAGLLTRLPPTLEVPGPAGLVPLVELHDLHATTGDFDGDGALDLAAAYGWDDVGRVVLWYAPSLRSAAPPPWGEADPRPPWTAPPEGCGCGSAPVGAHGLGLLALALVGLARVRGAALGSPPAHRLRSVMPPPDVHAALPPAAVREIVKQPTEGLTGFARLAVPLLGRWNTTRGGQRVVMGFVRQVSHRWIQAAMSRRLEVVGEERIRGLRPPRGVLLVANHRTFWDMYIATSVLGARTDFIERLHFPVRARFFYTNPVGVGINLAVAGGAMWPAMFGGFDRYGRNAAAIAAVVQSLERPGTLVGVHPEGTRNKGPDPHALLPAKGGAGRIVQALHPDVLVLPYFLDGVTNDLPREIVRNFLPEGRRGPRIRLAFGDPVPAGALDRTGTPRDVSERLLARVLALAEPPDAEGSTCR